jgi:hypothetical protein
VPFPAPGGPNKIILSILLFKLYRKGKLNFRLTLILFAKQLKTETNSLAYLPPNTLVKRPFVYLSSN